MPNTSEQLGYHPPQSLQTVCLQATNMLFVGTQVDGVLAAVLSTASKHR